MELALLAYQPISENQLAETLAKVPEEDYQVMGEPLQNLWMKGIQLTAFSGGDLDAYWKRIPQALLEDSVTRTRLQGAKERAEKDLQILVKLQSP